MPLNVKMANCLSVIHGHQVILVLNQEFKKKHRSKNASKKSGEVGHWVRGGITDIEIGKNNPALQFLSQILMSKIGNCKSPNFMLFDTEPTRQQKVVNDFIRV